MKIILKVIFFIFLLAIFLFIFFPFERIKGEIENSVEKTGIKYKTLATDYFRKITLEGVEVNFSGRKVQIENMAFYFRPFFIFRKNPAPQKVYIYGMEYDIQSLEKLKELIALPGEKKKIIVVFKNIKLRISELNRVFYLSGKIKDKRIDLNVFSGKLKLNARISKRENEYEIHASLKNFDLVGFFIKKPEIENSFFTGNFYGLYSKGKVDIKNLKGKFASQKISFSKNISIEKVITDLSLENDELDAQNFTANFKGLDLDGVLKVSLKGGKFVKAKLNIMGDFKTGKFSMLRNKGTMVISGMAENPLIKIKGEAEKAIYRNYSFEDVKCDLVYNERNSKKLVIKDANGKINDFFVSISGIPVTEKYHIKGVLSRTVKLGEKNFDFFATFVSSANALTITPSIKRADGKLEISGKIFKDKNNLKIFVKERNLDLNFSGIFRLEGNKVVGGTGDFFANKSKFSVQQVSGFGEKDAFLVKGRFDSSFDQGIFKISRQKNNVSFLLDGKDSRFEGSFGLQKENVPFDAKLSLKKSALTLRGTYTQKAINGIFFAEKTKKLPALEGSFDFENGIFKTKFSMGKILTGELCINKEISGFINGKDFPLSVLSDEINKNISFDCKLDGGSIEGKYLAKDWKDFKGKIRKIKGTGLDIFLKTKDFSGQIIALFSGLSFKGLKFRDFKTSVAEDGEIILNSEEISKKLEGKINAKIRNVGFSGLKFFGNLSCEVKKSTGIEVSGKFTNFFLNDLFLPFEFRAVYKKGEVNLFDVPESPVKLSGNFKKQKGNFKIKFPDSSVDISIAKNKARIFSQNIDIQKILRILKTEADIFGDIWCDLNFEKEKTHIAFKSSKIFVGTFIRTEGKVEITKDFFSPDIRVFSHPQGEMKVCGFLARGVNIENNFTIEGKNFKLEKILFEDGEIRNFNFNGKIAIGGFFENPEITAEGACSFEVFSKNYPDAVKFHLNFYGKTLFINGDGEVKGKKFKTDGKIDFLTGKIRKFLINFYFPHEGVPFVLPTLLLERRGFFGLARKRRDS